MVGGFLFPAVHTSVQKCTPPGARCPVGVRFWSCIVGGLPQKVDIHQLAKLRETEGN